MILALYLSNEKINQDYLCTYPSSFCGRKYSQLRICIANMIRYWNSTRTAVSSFSAKESQICSYVPNGEDGINNFTARKPLQSFANPDTRCCITFGLHQPQLGDLKRNRIPAYETVGHCLRFSSTYHRPDIG